jgi:membrane protease YdiL (CAAX protease family)
MKISIKNSVILYFILAIGITWLFWIPTLIISSVNDYFIPSILTFNVLITEGFVDSFHVLVFFINQIGVYGPMIAAFIVLAITKRREGVLGLLKSMGKVNVKLKWYAAIILLPLAITLASAGVSLLYGTDLTNLFNPGMAPLFVVLMFLNTTLTSGFEEPGWRGYALSKLQETYTANKSSIIVGIVWAIWHYPFLVYLNLVQLGTGAFLSVFAIIGFTASTVGGSILFSWVYNNTKSVFMAILFHGLMNFIPQIVMGGVTDSMGGVIVALITWGIAFIFVKKYGEQTLTGLTEEEKKAKEEKKIQKQKSKEN